MLENSIGTSGKKVNIEASVLLKFSSAQTHYISLPGEPTTGRLIGFIGFAVQHKKTKLSTSRPYGMAGKNRKHAGGMLRNARHEGCAGL
jgi:hypothetical protein